MSSVDPRLSQGVLVIVAALFCAWGWQGGYQVALGRDQRDQSQVVLLRQRLAKTSTMVEQAGGKTAWLTEHQQRLAALRAKLPSQEQLPAILDALVEAVKDADVKLVYMTQDDLELLRMGETPILIDGLSCYRLPVTMSVEGHYHAVRAALDQFTNEAFPALVSVQRVELQLKDVQSVTLGGTVRLHVYLTGAPAQDSHET